MIKSIHGTPIFKNVNSECMFYVQDNSKRSETPKFPICICPSRCFHIDKNHSMIISCSKEIDDCVIYSSQNKRDIEFIRLYLEKYAEGEWLSISNKHWEKILNEKISKVGDEKYLENLFKYCGYVRFNDDKIEGVVLTSEKNVKIEG